MKILIIIVALILLAIFLNIKFRKIKEISNDNSLNYITEKLPENKEVCRKILEIVNNNVIIEEQKDYKNSLYIAITNKIILGKMKIDSLRVLTIAHEVAHSIQNRRILFSNFIFANIFNIYFLVSVILTIFGVFKNLELQLYILTIMSIIFISLRNYLETDAMSKSVYIAEKYLNTTEINKNDKEKLLNKYMEVNSVGIPLINYITIFKGMLKPLIFSLLVFI